MADKRSTDLAVDVVFNGKLHVLELLDGKSLVLFDSDGAKVWEAETSRSRGDLANDVLLIEGRYFVIPDEGDPKINDERRATARRLLDSVEAVPVSSEEKSNWKAYQPSKQASDSVPLMDEENPASISEDSTVRLLEEEGWLKGEIAYVRLFQGLIQIRRTSLLADLALGPVRGDKNIPIRTIQAVQFKPATRLVSGALEFVVAGDTANTSYDSYKFGISGAEGVANALFGRRTARAVHENSITFSKKQEGPFIALYEQVLDAIATWGNPTPPNLSEMNSNPPVSMADELAKLGELLARGLLTEEEFRSAKQRLISG